MEIKPGFFVVLTSFGVDVGVLAARVAGDLDLPVGRTTSLCEFVCPAETSSIQDYLKILRREYPMMTIGAQRDSALHR